MHGTIGIACAEFAGKCRQQHHAYCDTNNAERELEQTVGIIEKCGTSGKACGECCSDCQVDLRDAPGDDAGNGFPDDALYISGELWNAECDRCLGAISCEHDQCQLGNACHGHGPGLQAATFSRIAVAHPPAKQVEQDHDDVEQDGGGGRCSKFSKTVQHTAEQGRQRHEAQIGETDARQFRGQRKRLRIIGETRRDDRHDPWHQGHAGSAQQQHPSGHDRKHVARKDKGFGLTLAFMHAGEVWHEGIVECAFGEECTEQVGQALGHDESFCDWPCTKCKSDELVAEKTEEAAEQGVTANCAG